MANKYDNKEQALTKLANCVGRQSFNVIDDKVIMFKKDTQVGNTAWGAVDYLMKHHGILRYQFQAK